MIKFLIIQSLFLSMTLFGATKDSSSTSIKTKINKKIDKDEVVDNPTLKTLSGSLNRWSLYSTYTYKGGSIDDPGSAERPNIRQREAKPNLANMSGVIGVKYRLTKQDNLSFQMGLYSTAPFHSSLDSDDVQNQKDFNDNHQQLNSDDPLVSYFRTYYIGKLQNISFFKYQYATRDSYRDYGLRGVFQFSHAAAYKISKAAYIAASLTYENYHYDKDTIVYYGRNVSIKDFQTEHAYRANLSTEFYLKKSLSFRMISDLFSYTQMRSRDTAEKVKLQQTIAMTYFFSRDISISPNIRFIAEDLRSERTNVGLTMNVNI